MELKAGQRYKHYKGNVYIIVALGRHSETGEELVVYQGQYDDPEFGPNPVWIRPRDLFSEHVLVNGKMVLRFSPFE
jgi:hypothetical protein